MKKRLLIFAFVIIIAVCAPCGILVGAESAFDEIKSGSIYSSDYDYIYDHAGLLSDAEKSELNEKLKEISEQKNMNILVLTVDMDLNTPVPEYDEHIDYRYDYDIALLGCFCDDFFNYGNFGENGVVYALNMNGIAKWLSTTGKAKKVFTDKGIEFINDAITPNLSKGEYYKAFSDFSEYCNKFITKAENGKPYDGNNMPRKIKAIDFSTIGKCLILGLIVAFVVTTVMKRKLKSVRFQPAASSYLIDNSLNITNQRDAYLYKHISKVAKSNNSSGGGGSSTHSSSSGSSHGGGGGRF